MTDLGVSPPKPIKEESTMKDIPSDILVEIFKLTFQSKQCVIRLLSVCSHWRKIILHSQLFWTAIFDKFTWSVKDASSFGFFKRCSLSIEMNDEIEHIWMNQPITISDYDLFFFRFVIIMHGDKVLERRIRPSTVDLKSLLNYEPLYESDDSYLLIIYTDKIIVYCTDRPYLIGYISIEKIYKVRVYDHKVYLLSNGKLSIYDLLDAICSANISRNDQEIYQCHTMEVDHVSSSSLDVSEKYIRIHMSHYDRHTYEYIDMTDLSIVEIALSYTNRRMKLGEFLVDWEDNFRPVKDNLFRGYHYDAETNSHVYTHFNSMVKDTILSIISVPADDDLLYGINSFYIDSMFVVSMRYSTSIFDVTTGTLIKKFTNLDPNRPRILKCCGKYIKHIS